VDVVLVVMPFADIGRPALGVSLLKAAAEREGFSVHIEYLNLRYAERIGAELYATIADSYPAELLAGEWLFAEDVFGSGIPPEADYVDRILGAYAPVETVAAVVSARHAVAAYLDDAAEAIAMRHPKVVGFTSTFHQTCPSLAVARRLKAGADPPVIVFGGANCEGEMGGQLLEIGRASCRERV